MESRKNKYAQIHEETKEVIPDTQTTPKPLPNVETPRDRSQYNYSTISISYDELLEKINSEEPDKNNETKKEKEVYRYGQKRQIVFYVLFAILGLGIVAALIVMGLLAF